MGSFLTNIQVFTGDGGATPEREALIAAIHRFAAGTGFPALREGEAPDRTIIVGPAGAAPWIAVYDEATEDQDMRKLEALAGDLSAALGTAAVTVLIHDSDALELRL